ncbi:MAG TPA: OB-fold nucleic acid binding domain-containing protein [Candidatus Acidoferrales bacterium]
MKSHYVSGLQDGQAITSLFLVGVKEIRTSQRTGKSWLELALRDRTGSIPAKMWDNFEALAKTFEADDVVQIRGRVKLYNGQKEMTLEQIVPAAARDYDLSDFLAHTKHDVEKLYADLGAAVAAVKNPWIKKLLESVVNDPAIVPKLKRAPAAMSMHHAFVGGLLEHTVSLIGLGRTVTAHYPELDADVLLAGIVLHDIGKIDELRYERATNYTTAGRLLGHITIGTLLVREKIKAIPGFPEPLAILIEHLILSHHGTYEFGSPSLPQTREAIALHFLDDMDSKMAAMRATLEGASGGDEWTERNPALHRALLRTDKFLAGEDAGRSAEAAAESSSQRTAPGAPRNTGGAQ